MQDQKKPVAPKALQNPTSVKSEATAVPSAADALEKMEKLGDVKVIHGANDDVYPIAGCRVSLVRANLVDAFNIPADALAFVDGEQVDNEYILKEGAVLEFIKAAGVKG